MGFFPVSTQAGTIPVLEPSGDTSGAADARAINALLAAGQPVFLLPGGHYYISAPITAWTSGSFMTGYQWWSASPADNYGTPLAQTRGGAIIEVTATFPNNRYAFELVNSVVGVQQYGVDISGVNLYGWNIPDTSDNVGLMLVRGAWGACFLRGCGLIGSTGDVADFITDGTTGKVPDDWQVTDCKFSGSLNGNGVLSEDTPDFWWDNCESSENKLDNWVMAFGTNSRFSNCKAENSSTANGWHFTGLGAGNIITLDGCTSQFNWTDGFLFDNAAGAGTGLGTYQLNGCASTHDAQSGAGWAGFDAEGCLSRVMGANCTGQLAQYGAFEGAASYFMCFTGSFFTGTTAATHDDGSNTHVLVNQSPVAF